MARLPRKRTQIPQSSVRVLYHRWGRGLPSPVPTLTPRIRREKRPTGQASATRPASLAVPAHPTDLGRLRQYPAPDASTSADAVDWLHPFPARPPTAGRSAAT
ncbi:hypothetical protein GCM10012279_09630 [Micromonospora yangpuensis]|nr:hypothetical protein GCM10012279_09630 [Micromonospora yangpuensis]